MTPTVNNIPATMRGERRWLVWRFETPPGRNKPTKVPYRANGRGNASSTDPATWSDFDSAMQTHKLGDYAGIGFALGDGWAGVDLDDCLNESSSFTWGDDIVAAFDTYGEVSPSGTGVKLFLHGRKPDDITSTAKRGVGPDGSGRLEVYDHGRWFAVTSEVLDGKPCEVRDCNKALADLCRRYFTGDAREPVTTNEQPGADTQFRKCLASMLSMSMTDGADGSRRLFAAACRCVEHGLNKASAIRCIREYARLQPFPTNWTDVEIVRRLRDGSKSTERDEQRAAPILLPAFKSARQLLADHPHLRRPIIHGLLRQGETMNLIAPSKTGKSWLVNDLALSIAAGRVWLGKLMVERGDVLILDNELHGETTASRLPKVAEARGILSDEWVDHVHVENLRGRLADIFNLRPYFDAIEPGRFKAIILDAQYRFLPPDTNENDNGTMAAIYNQLDCYAALLGCAFILIHHSSKGNQGEKAVTDVGAGAGAQSRAADAHVVLRAHEQDGAVVMDAVVRSRPPTEPLCLRWNFPVFTVDASLDPAQLRTGRKRRGKPAVEQASTPAEPWTVESFVAAFVTGEPVDRKVIAAKARVEGLGVREIETLLTVATADGKAHRWTFPKDRTVCLANRQQSVTDITRKAG